MIIIRKDQPIEKKFSILSKALWLISPSAWNAKEAEKFISSNKEEYKKNRFKAAIKGILMPFTARKRLVKAQQAAESGLSPEEIKDAVGNWKTTNFIAEKGTNALTGGLSGAVSHGMGLIRSLRTKCGNELRKEFK